MKKGQITIFIVIAIILVVGVVIFFSLNNFKMQGTGSAESDEVYKFILECSEFSLKKIVWLAGIGGGYIITPENSNEIGIPYYYNQGVKSIISKEELEKEIEFYFNQEFAICLNNFSDFKNLNINSEEIKSKVVIHDEEVILKLDYLVNIQKGENSYLLDKFDEIILDLKLGKILKIAEKIVNEDIEEDSICLTCSLDDLEENDLKLEIFEDEGEFIFIIIDESNLLNEMEFIYSFGVKK